MNGVNKVNYTFLITLVLIELVSLIGIGKYISTYTMSLIISQVLLAAPAVIYLFISRVPYTKAVRFKRMRISDILLCGLFFILTKPLLTFVNAISLMFTRNTISNYIYNVNEESPFIVGLLIVAVIPCILEETVYRGVFYNEYRKAKPLAAIFLSALMFGLMHGNLNQFSYAFVMGIIFALLIEATDSILSTMIVHFLTNALSTLILYCLPSLMEMLRTMHDSAISSGNNELVAYIESLIGSSDFSVESMLDASQSLNGIASFGDILRTYGFSAAVGTLLAFFVFRSLAKRSGRWDYICSLFSKSKRAEFLMRQKQYINYVKQGYEGLYLEETTPQEEKAKMEKILEDCALPTGERLLTWPLLAGIALCLYDIVVNELVLAGILVLK